MIFLNAILKTTIVGLFFGTFGTTLGGIFGIISKRSSNKFLSFILSLAAGLMTAVICFDLIPKSLEIGNILLTFLGILFGVILMFFCDLIVEKKCKIKTLSTTNKSKETLLKTGIIVSIGLAIHNFPEGLAIRKWI